jgi:hypothetical protein
MTVGDQVTRVLHTCRSQEPGRVLGLGGQGSRPTSAISEADVTLEYACRPVWVKRRSFRLISQFHQPIDTALRFNVLS